MEKIRTVLSKELQKERYGALIKFSIIITIIGVLFISYCVYGFITDSGSLMDGAILAVGLFLIVFGIIFTITINGTYKKAERLNIYTDMTFNEDHIYAEKYEDDELVATEKIYYKKCISFFETKSFVFFTTDSSLVYAINKENGIVDFLLNKGIPSKSNKKK